MSAARLAAWATLTVAVTLPACTDAGLTDEDARQVVGIEVTPTQDTMDALGLTRRFTARAINALGDPVPGRSFTWASSDLLVARVDEDGNVEAVGNGASDITASVDGAVT